MTDLGCLIWASFKADFGCSGMINTTRKMSISDQEFFTDPKTPLKKSYL